MTRSHCTRCSEPIFACDRCHHHFNIWCDQAIVEARAVTAAYRAFRSPPITLPLTILCEGRLALLEEHGITWWRRWSNAWVPVESALGNPIERPNLVWPIQETWSWHWSAFVSRYDQFTIWRWVHAPLYSVGI